MQFAGERLSTLRAGRKSNPGVPVTRPTENPAGCFVQARAVLRVKRKGRTGFKPSGLRDAALETSCLRDELPDLSGSIRQTSKRTSSRSEPLYVPNRVPPRLSRHFNF